MWNLISALDEEIPSQTVWLSLVFLLTVGVSVFSIKYYLFYRRQNRVPQEIQRKFLAGSSIRVETVAKIAKALNAEIPGVKKPTLLWGESGIQIYDVITTSEFHIPYREVDWANFSHASAYREILGYLKLSISGFVLKTGIWVYDGYGKSFPIGVEREAEFLSMIGQPKSK